MRGWWVFMYVNSRLRRKIPPALTPPHTPSSHLSYWTRLEKKGRSFGYVLNIFAKFDMYIFCQFVHTYIQKIKPRSRPFTPLQPSPLIPHSLFPTSTIHSTINLHSAIFPRTQDANRFIPLDTKYFRLPLLILPPYRPC